MSPAQRAILAKAKKDGLKPSDQAREFLLHDLVEACLQQLKNYSVAWKNLGEKEQDASIASLIDALKDSVTDAIRIIIGAGASAIPFKLKKLSIDGKLTVTGLVEGDHPERHALTDKAHDKSEILLILSPRDYFEGMEDIKGERDQKTLPLDPAAAPEPAKGNAAAKAKATESAKSAASVAGAASFKPADLEKARKFCEQYRTPTVAGIQNALSCGFNKGDAILQELVHQGVVIKNEDSTYSMPPAQVEDGAATAGNDAQDPAKASSDPADKPLDWGDSLTDELYEKMKAKVIADQKVSSGRLAVAFDCPIPIADQAIERMEMAAVISEEDEMGQREVFDQLT